MNQKHMPDKFTIWLIFIIISLVSCRKEDPLPIPPTTASEGVFICNEGNFTFGNGSLSFYNPEKKIVSNQTFYHANDFPLGDVVFSMSILGDKGFVVVNNSGKIVVHRIDNYKHIATISGLTSPRYIEFITPDKAYVTDLFSPFITIIDPGTYTVTGNISVGKRTEQMTRVGDYVYVTGWSDNNKVYKIHWPTDKLTDSITVVRQPNSIVHDRYNRLWVLSDGGYQGSPLGQDTAALTCINSSTFQTEKVLRFSSVEGSPSKLCINHLGDTLFFLHGSWGGVTGNESGVYQMPVNASGLPAFPLIPENNRMFYALGVSPVDSRIYVSDAIDYIQKGWVFSYTLQGVVIDSFKTDIIPGAFCFK